MSHARWKTLRERKLAEGYTEPEDVTETRRFVASNSGRFYMPVRTIGLSG